MKKVLALLLIVSVVLGGFVGCGKKDDGKIKIGVSIANFDDTFLMYMKDGMDAFAKGLGEDVVVEYVDAKEDMAKQMDQVENFLVQGMDAIVIVPVDTSATSKMTELCKEDKVPLVYVNRNPGNLPEGVYYVGSEEVVAGRLQMDYLADKLGGQGKVAVLMGKLDNEGAIKRTEGVEEIAAKHEGINIVDKQTGKWQRAEGMTVTEDWLNRFGEDLKAIASNNDDMALGAIQALKDAGRADVMVVGVDATPDGLAALEAGDLSATVFQDAAGQGGGAIDTALKAVKGESVEQEVMIPFKLVTPENLKDFQ